MVDQEELGMSLVGASLTTVIVLEVLRNQK